MQEAALSSGLERQVVFAMPFGQLRVSEIPPEGTQIQCQVPLERLGLDPGDVRACGDFSLCVEIAAVGTRVTGSGRLAGRVFRQCVRCLVEYEDDCEIPFSVQYEVEQPDRRGSAQPNQSRESAGSDDTAVLAEGDRYSYSGDLLDLAPMLREQVILATPFQPLCRDDCRGLCPVCGQDRNRRPCDCPEESLPNPFQVLRRLQVRHDRSTGSV